MDAKKLLGGGRACRSGDARRQDLPSHALAGLAALGQPTRLEIFRLLMRREPGGLTAGVIAETVGCQQNTLSTHLSILARSGLIRGTRDGRSIVYRADVDGMRTLIAFLVTDCCDGHPEICNLPDPIARERLLPARVEKEPTQEIAMPAAPDKKLSGSVGQTRGAGATPATAAE